MQTFVRLIAVLLVFLFAREIGAEEKNGLLVNVSKRTLNRSDRTTSYYTQFDRTQGYKVAIKNTSLKPMAEGEVTWTILVIKAGGYAAEKYTGVEKLKPLLPAESVDLLVGAVPIGGYRSDRTYKDEMEYEFSITHGGKEAIRMTSKPAFAALAKRATLMDSGERNEENADAGRGRAGLPGMNRRNPRNQPDPAPLAGVRNATPNGAPIGVPGAPVGVPRAPIGAPNATPNAAPVSPVPVVPVGAVPPAAVPSPAPATPAAPSTPTPVAPAAPAVTPAPAPPADAPFDFFNLNGKKPAPAAK